MDKYICLEVDERFNAHRTLSMPSATRNKSMIELALIAYQRQKGNNKNSEQVDDFFKTMAINQMKIILILGPRYHSQYHLLRLYWFFVHPRALSQVRAEVDHVFSGSV